MESNNQQNMLFVDGGANRIGMQTASPEYVFHVSNNGINIGATALTTSINSGSSGVSLSGYKSTTNGYNTIERVTGGTYSGVFGLGINEDNGNNFDAIGVYGHANDLQGYGVYGVRSSIGGGIDSGFGGLFMNDLRYSGGLFTVSGLRLKKEISPIVNSIDIIKRLNPVTYYYDIKKQPTLGLNKGL